MKVIVVMLVAKTKKVKSNELPQKAKVNVQEKRNKFTISRLPLVGLSYAKTNSES
jgi:hypothetical protein